MKLKLTLDEARILVTRALNLPSDTEIVFARRPNRNMPEIRSLIQSIDGMDYRASGKIPAIKRFREVVATAGLAEAKWTVENWETVRTFMLTKKRFPTFTGNYNDGTMAVA